MFQTTVLGSFSTQLKVSEIQGLAIWIYKLAIYFYFYSILFYGSVGRKTHFMASWTYEFLSFVALFCMLFFFHQHL